MECPYCESELDYEGPFGRLAAHQDGKVFGHVYRCPAGHSEDESCESSVFHVAGSFYEYESNPGELHEGYPC